MQDRHQLAVDPIADSGGLAFLELGREGLGWLLHLVLLFSAVP